jgi:hypothetical protein
MNMNKFLIPLAAACLAGAASADTPNFVDAQGNGFPVTVITLPVQGPSYTQDMWISPSPDVYAALDSTIPSGIYYFQLLDLDFNNLSELALGDRMFEVVNNAGALTVTRMGGTPDLPAPGAGAGGVGQSIPLFPFVSAPYYPNRPELLCAHKAIIFELLPDGSNRIVRSGFFRVGDGQLASISGIVFNDLDRDGARDAGEQGIAGRTVKLISNNPATAGQVVATKTTGAGDCSVVLEIDAAQYLATTPMDVRLGNCGCGSQIVDFGAVPLASQCEGRTPGFWRNNNGIAQINAGQWWDELRDLKLVNAIGWNFDPSGNVCLWKGYMGSSSGYNMAYKLSTHLAAMKLNVLSGRVSENCRVHTPFGEKTIGQLIQMANAALIHDPFTPPCDDDRAYQEQLKTVLDKANNNLNWL